MCTCIAEMNKRLQDKLKDPEAALDVLFSLEGEVIQHLFVTYTYRKKKRNGEWTKKTYTGKLALSKCPFCGEGLNKSV